MTSFQRRTTRKHITVRVTEPKTAAFTITYSLQSRQFSLPYILNQTIFSTTLRPRANTSVDSDDLSMNNLNNTAGERIATQTSSAGVEGVCVQLKPMPVDVVELTSFRCPHYAPTMRTRVIHLYTINKSDFKEVAAIIFLLMWVPTCNSYRLAYSTNCQLSPTTYSYFTRILSIIICRSRSSYIACCYWYLCGSSAWSCSPTNARCINKLSECISNRPRSATRKEDPASSAANDKLFFLLSVLWRIVHSAAYSEQPVLCSRRNEIRLAYDTSIHKFERSSRQRTSSFFLASCRHNYHFSRFSIIWFIDLIDLFLSIISIKLHYN